MYYSEKVRKQKVKELENNRRFIEYAQKEYEVYKRVDNLNGYNTFEKFLAGEVFDIYESFTMFEILKNADRELINRAIDIAIVDI